MATKPSKPSAAKVTASPARKKLTLKKDALKDMAAAGKAKAVKGGANYSRNLSGAY